jgi:hypothetical protein
MSPVKEERELDKQCRMWNPKLSSVVNMQVQTRRTTHWPIVMTPLFARQWTER